MEIEEIENLEMIEIKEMWEMKMKNISNIIRKKIEDFKEFRIVRKGKKKCNEKNIESNGIGMVEMKKLVKEDKVIKEVKNII